MDTDNGKRRIRSLTWAAGLVAAGVIAGGVAAASLPATAGTTPSPSTSSGGTSSGTTDNDGPGGQRPDETLLTGDNLAKAKAAALKAVPGATIDRVETDADGAVYEAHLTKADGTRVTVKFDKSFNVTAVLSGMGGGGRHDGAAPGSTSGTSSSST